MRTLFIIPLVLMSLVSFPSWATDFKSCSKQEMQDVWLKLQEVEPQSDKERFCLAMKTIAFMEDVFIKDISPLTPKETEWVNGEYDYIRNGTSQTRKNSFLNHELKFKYDLFNNVRIAKENLFGVLWAINRNNKQFEMQSWANTVAGIIEYNIYDDYRQLVKRGLVEQNPKAGLWSAIILPDLLRKGIVLNTQ